MAMREIELKVLDTVDESLTNRKLNTLFMSAEDYDDLFSDFRRAQDVLQVLNECLSRVITIRIDTDLQPGEFEWVDYKENN
jgi:hypothetical protein